MRTIPVTVAGSTYALPVTFAAIQAVDARAGDPWAMCIGYHLGRALSLLQVVNVIVAGAMLCDKQLSPEDMAERMVDAGAAQWAEDARAYVFALCEGKSAHSGSAQADPKK